MAIRAKLIVTPAKRWKRTKGQGHSVATRQIFLPYVYEPAQEIKVTPSEPAMIFDYVVVTNVATLSRTFAEYD